MKNNIRNEQQNIETGTHSSSIVYYGKKQKTIIKDSEGKKGFTNFVKNYIWILVSIISFLAIVGFTTYMLDKEYYDSLFYTPPIRGIFNIKELIINLILWIPRYITILVARAFIFPVVDGITFIILWLLKGGVVSTILNSMLFSDEPNIFKTALFLTFIIGIVVFVISLVIMFLKQLTSLEEKDFGIIIKNSFKSAFLFLFAFFIFISLYLLTSLGTAFLLTSIGKGQKFSTIIVMSNVMDSSGADKTWEKLLTNKPLSPNELWDYNIYGDYWIVVDPGLSPGDAGYGWWNDGGESFYSDLYTVNTDGTTILTGESWDKVAERFNDLSWNWTQDAYHKMTHYCSVLGVVASGLIMLVLMIIFFIQLFVRAFKLTGLLIISPYPSAVAVLDGGEKFKEWQKNSFETFMEILLFALLLIIYLGVLQILPELYDDFMSGQGGLITGGSSVLPIQVIFNISIMCGAGYAVTLLPAEFNGIIGAIGALLGAKMMGKTVKGIASAGKAMASGGASLAGTAMESSGLTEKLENSKMGQKMGELKEKKEGVKSLLNGGRKEDLKATRDERKVAKDGFNAKRSILKDKMGQGTKDGKKDFKKDFKNSKKEYKNQRKDILKKTAESRKNSKK